MSGWGAGGRGRGENPEYPEKTPDSQPEDQYIIIITGEKPLIVRIGSVWSEIAGFNQVSYRQIHLSLQICWTVRLLPRGHVSLFSPLTYIVVISLWLPSTCFLTSTDKHLADRVCSATDRVCFITTRVHLFFTASVYSFWFVSSFSQGSHRSNCQHFSHRVIMSTVIIITISSSSSSSSSSSNILPSVMRVYIHISSFGVVIL